jgi:hypothetical protein
VAVPISEFDIHNMKLVDVFEIFTDGGLCVVGAAFTEDYVASRAFSYATAVMSVNGLVAV